MSDWKISVKKGLLMFCKVFIAGLLSMLGTGEINIPVLIVLIPVLESGLNYLKHLK